MKSTFRLYILFYIYKFYKSYFDKEAVVWFLEFHLNRTIFLWIGIGAIWLVIFNRFLDRYNFAEIPRIYSLLGREWNCKIVSKPLQTFNCGHSLGIVIRFINETMFILAWFHFSRLKISNEKATLHRYKTLSEMLIKCTKTACSG